MMDIFDHPRAEIVRIGTAEWVDDNGDFYCVFSHWHFDGEGRDVAAFATIPVGIDDTITLVAGYTAGELEEMAHAGEQR